MPDVASDKQLTLTCLRLCLDVFGSAAYTAGGAHWRNADAGFRLWNRALGHPTPVLHGGRAGVRSDPLHLAQEEVIAEARRRLPAFASKTAAPAPLAAGDGLQVGSRVRVHSQTGRLAALNDALATVTQVLDLSVSSIYLSLSLYLSIYLSIYLHLNLHVYLISISIFISFSLFFSVSG